MSEPTPPNEPAAPAPDNAPPSPAEPTPPSAAAPAKTSAPAAKRSRAARWRHRWAVLFWTVVIVFGVFRIAVSIAMPTVLRRVTSYYNLDCTYDRLQLSFSGGQATLWHAALTPKGGGERVVYADYVHGNIDPFQLLRGRLIVWRAEVDGTEMTIERKPDGSIPLVDRLVAQKADAATAAAQSKGPPKPLMLDAPLRVDALRATHLVAHLHDQSVSPPVDTRLVLQVRASDLGQRVRPTSFEISLAADGILDELQITGEKRGDQGDLDADVAVVVRGLRLKPAAGYLQPLGIKPVADDMTMRLRAHVKAVATTRPTTLPSLSGSLALREITLLADGQEAVGLDKLSIDVLSLDSRSAQFGKLAIDGVRVSGSRGENGNVRLAGIELVPTTQPAAAAAAATTRPAVADAAKPSPYHASLRGFEVGHVRLRFDDRAVSPPVSLTTAIDELRSKDFNFDPSQPGAPMNIGGKFRVPGLAESITLAGSLTPFADRKSLDLTLDLAGLRPDLLKPYLDAAGIDSLYQAGTLHCRLTGAARVDDKGRLAADGQLSDLKLADGGKELFGMGIVRLAGVSVDPASGIVHADAIDLAGPTLTARRAKDGSITALGFRMKPPGPATTQPAPVASATTAPASQPASGLPRFELGRFSWKDVHLELADETVDPPATLSLGDAGFEATDVTFDLNATHAGKPGTLHAWLNAPGLARRLNVEGTVTPQPNAVALDLKIAGEGLSGVKVAPYLKPLGIEPTLRDGSLAVTLRGTLARHGSDLASTLAIEQLKFTDGATELASLARLAVKDLTTAGNESRVGAIDVDRPHLRAARDADGWLSVGGVRIDPNRKSTPSTQPSIASITSATIKDAQVAWTDRAVSPAVETTATVNLEVRNATLGKNGAQPGTIKLALSTADSIGKLTAEGNFLVSPDAQTAKLALVGEGIRQGTLGGYLPPGLSLETKDGRLKADLDASVVKSALGGQAVHVALDGFEWGDGTSPLLKLGTVHLNAPRVDPEGKVIAVDELTVTGLDTAARLDPGGATRVAGLALGPAAANAQQAKAPATTQPAAPVSATQLAAKAREALPLVTIRKLDVGVDRVSVRDATRPGSAPVIVSGLHLTNPDPIAWLGPDATNLPPTKLNVDGRIDPLVERLAVRATVAPFALQPSADVDWALTGIRGEGMMKVVPELSTLLDGRPLTDGSFKGHAEAHLTLDRRVANDFDLSKGFALDLLMKTIEFRAAPGGPVLLGLNELRTENAHFRANGGIQVKSLELDKPVGCVVRDHDGLHLLGMAVKIAGQPATTTQPTTQVATTEPTAAPATTEPTSQPLAVAVATPPQPTTKPAAEMRIDRLLISGLDLRVEDRTVEPPMILPLTGLDVDVRGLSNWLPYEDKAIRFTVLVSSGKVPLPGRAKAGGDASATEERGLFSEAALSGQLALYPQPRGWVKTSLNGVEAVGFAGEARPHGVNLGGGTFDASADVRFPGDGSAKARARFVANDLLVAEKPDGPIGNALKLNMPLSAAIKLLEAPDGSITIPVSVSVENGQLHGLGSSAVGAVAGVFAVAAASAPLKVATGALSMAGLKLGGKAVDLTPVTLKFPPGDAGLEPDAQNGLAGLIERLRKNRNLDVILRQQPGGGDVTAAGRRVNLDPQEAALFAEGLHARKLELQRLRAQVAGQARAQLVASSSADADGTLERLKGIDRELSQTEDALDHVYDLLRPGAERQADRRARQATIELGTNRLLAVRAALLASGVPDIDRRVKLTNALFNPTEDESAGGTVTIELATAKRKR